jgi:hypothetical protein
VRRSGGGKDDDSVLHGGVSELMATCTRRSFKSTTLGFMDGVTEVVAATLTDLDVLLLCPR